MTNQTSVLEISDCFDEFDSWFQELIERTSPDMVIAIARGAARLLKLRGVLDGSLEIPVYAHHALPFLEDKQIRGQRVLIFDDSFIYGSTMANVSEYLTNRGAIVIHAAYVANSASFTDDPKDASPHRKLNPKIKKFLNEEAVRCHHAALVQQVLHQGFDFNLDFPLVVCQFTELRAAEIPFQVTLLETQPSFVNLRNVTYPISGYSAVERWTALHEWCPAPEQNAAFISQPNSKTRLTFVPEQGQICLRPIVQYAIHSGIRRSDIRFRSAEINALWESLVFDIEAGDRYRDAAILRLLTFFGAMLLGTSIAHDVEQALLEECELSAVTFDAEDAVLVFGARLAPQLERTWNELRRIYHTTSLDQLVVLDRKLPCDGLRLRPKILEFVEHNHAFRPVANDTAIEAIGKLFLVIQEVTDSKEVRRAQTNSKRLDVGISFDGLHQLLTNDFGLDIANDELSLALDYCIDRALAVPKVIPEEGWWLREFYSGEDTKDQEIVQFHKKLHSATKQTNPKGRNPGFTPFEMHKLCATLRGCAFFTSESCWE